MYSSGFYASSTKTVDWPVTGEPWSRLHLDYAGPVDGKRILTVIDAYSKWIEATATNHATSDSTIRQLRELFSRFGIPRTVVTDNGTPFTSEEFSQFLKRNHVEHYRTAPYHPQ